MSLEFSSNNYNHFSLKWVFYQSILRSNCLTLNALHKFRTKYHNVSTVFNENAITLDEVFVPEEQIITIAMLYWSNCTLMRTLYALYHLVGSQCVSLRVSTSESATFSWSRNFLAKIGNFYLFNLALFIYDFQIVLINL